MVTSVDDNNIKPALWKLFTPLFLGAVAPILIYHTIGLSGKNLTIELSFVAVVFIVCSIVSCWLLPYNVRDVVVKLFIGIAVGMMVNSIIDLYFFHYDRNLIPFEILLMWIMAALPIALGSVFGCWLFLLSTRAKQNDGKESNT
jgi:hypothetical protein